MIIFPAIDISKSATRKQELLLDADELLKINKFRRGLAGLGTVEAAQNLLNKLHQFPTNKELLATF